MSDDDGGSSPDQLLVDVEACSDSLSPEEPPHKKLKINDIADPSDQVMNLAAHLAPMSSDIGEVGQGLMTYPQIEEEEEIQTQEVLVHGNSADLLVNGQSGMVINPSAYNILDSALVVDPKLEDNLQPCTLVPGTQLANVNGQVVQIVQLPESNAPCQFVPAGFRVIQLVHPQNQEKREVCNVVTLNQNGEVMKVAHTKQDANILNNADIGLYTNSSLSGNQMLSSSTHISGVPSWVLKLKDYEQIGKAYRGWVDTEIELDLLLTLHKQQTASFWGTRQSPCSSKPSSRLMWKSQYVPFDGVPFINSGSRAMVMECQYGPRRKGGTALAKRLDGTNKNDYRQTCPARIYVKKVVKFPQFAVDPKLDKKSLHTAMGKAFQRLREAGPATGMERFYVELPVESAHEFHIDLPAAVPARLDYRIAQRVRDIVSAGETRLYVIRKSLRRYVERELFECPEDLPPKHDLSFYPTVNDLQNHIHHAIKDIETGVLPITAEAITVNIMPSEELKNALKKDSEASIIDSESRPETITVTLNQHPGTDGEHVISKVETHMSDGTTRVSTSLNTETAKLLARLHPAMFPESNTNGDNEEDYATVKEESVVNEMPSDSHLLQLQTESDPLPSDPNAVFLSPHTHHDEHLGYTVVVGDPQLSDIVNMENVVSQDTPSSPQLSQSGVGVGVQLDS